MADEKFDPSKHLTQISGKDYLQVQWRLVWLRSEHPNASLVTELVERQGNFAIFKATVSIPEGGSATGYGSEDVDDFGDFIEKAETKAIGRALAALGFGTQFCEDFDEGGAVTDSPVERKRPAARPAAPKATVPDPQEGLGRNTGQATEQQIAIVEQLVDDWKGGDERAACEAVLKIMPTAVNEAGTALALKTLTQDAASKLIVGIQDARRVKRTAVA